MSKARKVAIVKSVTMLAVAFRQEASPALVETYQIGLDGLDADEISRATERALRECEFMPPPAVLRKLAGIMDIESRSILAWGAFQDAQKQHGYYESVDFDDPVINATVRNLGGWCELTERIEDEDKTDTWVRKDFERVYQALCRSGIGTEQGRYLPGWHERRNLLDGYRNAVTPPVKMITGLPAHPAGIVRLAGPQRNTVPVELLETIGRLPAPIVEHERSK